ncbi:ABC transporter ATP-binding protein [Arcanobacterium canis]
MSILEVQNLTKKYGERTIIESLSFTLESQQTMAVTGQSGSGKSTLLNMIGLLEEPTSGTIRVDGKDTPGINSSAATKLRRSVISYLFQSYALLESQTALQNVLLGMKYSPLPKKNHEAEARRVLKSLGLGSVIDASVSTLSGGEQQRVAIARCMLKPGKIILADEPTGALDQHLAGVVLDELFALCREFGKALVMVTHDPAIAQRCERQLRIGTN